MSDLMHCGHPVSAVRGEGTTQYCGFCQVYRERVPPALNPGALWVRVCAGAELLAAHRLGNLDGDLSPIESVAAADLDLAEAGAERHGEARVFIYDGDSGECVGTIIVGGPEPEIRHGTGPRQPGSRPR